MVRSFLTAFLVASLVLPPQAFASPPTEDSPPASSGVELQLTLPPRLNLRMPSLEYSILRAGQTLTATSDTILMTPETFARIGIEVDSINNQHNLYLEQHLRLSHASSQLQLGLLQNQNLFLEGELQRTNELLVRSQELNSSNNSGWFVAIGFGVGVLTAIGLAYAIAPAMK